MNYYNESTQVYLNGNWLPASEASTSLYSQTMHYGNGVFEGIRAYKTEGGVSIFKAKEHFERLIQSAKLMHVELNYSARELEQITYELLDRNQLENAYIRPLVYLDPNMQLIGDVKANLFICAWPWDRYLGDNLLRLMTSSYQRPNPKSCHVEAKTVGHYTNSILATTEAKQKGFDEALLTDQNGFVAEGPGANFFFEKRGVLYTPPLGNILNGITRQTMFELCQELDFTLEEKYFTIEEVLGADGAFFTGTAAEVAGVESLDDIRFELSWEETMGFELSRMYSKRVQNQDYNCFELV